MSAATPGRGLPWAAALLGLGAIGSGIAAVALAMTTPRGGRQMVGPAPAAADLMADVGGRRIHLRCAGSGKPTIILTGGAGATTGSWRRVQPELARRTRTCAWDRAGFGGSDGSPARQIADETAEDLGRALAAARIEGPLLLVGHSIGAYETLRFADRHPGRVAGIVLVDPSIPDMFRRMAGGSDAGGEAAARATMAPLAQPHAACLRALEAGTPAPPGLNIPCAPSTPPAKPRTALSFYESAGASAVAIADPARSYGARPLVLLTAGPEPSQADDSDPAKAAAQRARRSWVAQHDALVRLSTAGVHRFVPDSGHMIHNQRPQAIVDAVDTVLEQLRQD